MKNPGGYLFGFLSRFVFLLAVTASNSFAYELSTHAAITSKALADKAVLGVDEALRRQAERRKAATKGDSKTSREAG